MNTESGSADYIVANVRGWLNKSTYKIPDFAGVPKEKLIVSFLASEDAYDGEYAEYYVDVDTITEAF